MKLRDRISKDGRCVPYDISEHEIVWGWLCARYISFVLSHDCSCRFSIYEQEIGQRLSRSFFISSSPSSPVFPYMLRTLQSWVSLFVQLSACIWEHLAEDRIFPQRAQTKLEDRICKDGRRAFLCTLWQEENAEGFSYGFVGYLYVFMANLLLFGGGVGVGAEPLYRCLGHRFTFITRSSTWFYPRELTFTGWSQKCLLMYEMVSSISSAFRKGLLAAFCYLFLAPSFSFSSLFFLHSLHSLEEYQYFTVSFFQPLHFDVPARSHRQSR